MPFTFRIRFNRSPTDTIQTEAREIVLHHNGTPGWLHLHDPEPNGAIVKAKQLVLIGHGYSSPEEASAAGEKYQSALIVALARHRIGADFGLRVPKGLFTNHGLA